MQIEVCAKINWALDITGERPDGYHLMDMLMQPISLTDTVTLEPSDRLCLTVSGTPFIPPDENHLALKAARLLKAHCKGNPGASLHVHKRIPHQAGLGGGSADAAAVLEGLRRLWHLDLSPQAMSDLALRLGADVPFFLTGGLCRVRGIGEKITRLGRGPVWPLLILKPESGLSTRRVFEAWHRQGSEARPDLDHLGRVLLESDSALLPLSPGNVLESVSMDMACEIRTGLQYLEDQGALCRQMSGSGTAVFGVFPSAESRDRALAAAPMPAFACTTCGEAMTVKENL